MVFVVGRLANLAASIVAPAVSLALGGQAASGSMRQANKLLACLYLNRRRTNLLRAVAEFPQVVLSPTIGIAGCGQTTSL